MKTKKTPQNNPIYSAGEKTRPHCVFLGAKKEYSKQQQKQSQALKQTGKPEAGRKASGQAERPQSRQEGLKTGRKASGQAGKPQSKPEADRLDKKTEQPETNHVRAHSPPDLPETAGVAAPAADGWINCRQAA